MKIIMSDNPIKPLAAIIVSCVVMAGAKKIINNIIPEDCNFKPDEFKINYRNVCINIIAFQVAIPFMPGNFIYSKVFN